MMLIRYAEVWWDLVSKIRMHKFIYNRGKHMLFNYLVSNENYVVTVASAKGKRVEIFYIQDQNTVIFYNIERQAKNYLAKYF
jgi:hypothetical protein